MIHIKDYISYSQFKLFMQSPESYKKVYIFGYRFSNKYTEFGSKIHKVLEDRVATDEDGEMALKLMPKAQKREVIVEAELGGVPVYGKIDGVNKTKTGYSIIDYKTSKKGWTQRQVDKSEQLTFYVAMFCSLNKIPMDSLKVWLNCLRTFEDIDGIGLTDGGMLFYDTLLSMDNTSTGLLGGEDIIYTGNIRGYSCDILVNKKWNFTNQN